MTTTEGGRGPTSPVDAALRAADPAMPYLASCTVDEELAGLGVRLVGQDLETIAAAGRRRAARRRLPLAAGLTALSVAVVGGGAALAGTFTTHTGQYGRGESGAGEMLNPGAPDFLPYARKITAHTTFAPGDSAENYWWWFVVKNLDGSYSLMSTDGVKGVIADDASCSWQRMWLRAYQAGDVHRMDTASKAIHKAARSADLRRNNNARYTEQLIDAADAGDPSLLETSLRMACPSPKPLAP